MFGKYSLCFCQQGGGFLHAYISSFIIDNTDNYSILVKNNNVPKILSYVYLLECFVLDKSGIAFTGPIS
jgi:hypothetical protein